MAKFYMIISANFRKIKSDLLKTKKGKTLYVFPFLLELYFLLILISQTHP